MFKNTNVRHTGEDGYKFSQGNLSIELSVLMVYDREGNGNALQYFCLEDPIDGGAWWAAVHGVARSWTRLKRLSSSSSSGFLFVCLFLTIFNYLLFVTCGLFPITRIREGLLFVWLNQTSKHKGPSIRLPPAHQNSLELCFHRVELRQICSLFSL